MPHDQCAQTGSVGQRTLQHARVGDDPVAIGEGHGTGVLQEADLDHLAPIAAFGQRGHVGHPHLRVDLGPAGNEFQHFGRVDRRVRIGARDDGCDPPRAAARPADRKDSLCRSPGSLTFTPRSTMPGARHLPLQSMGCAVSEGASAIRPATTYRSPISSVPVSGSIRRALRKVRSMAEGLRQARLGCPWGRCPRRIRGSPKVFAER